MAAEQPVTDLVEQRPVQLALRVEVLIEHRLGDPRRLGDVVHRRAVESGQRANTSSATSRICCPRTVAGGWRIKAREVVMVTRW